MAHQTTYLSAGIGPLQGVASRVTKFAVTAMDLLTLQSRMVVEDSRDAQRHLKGAGFAILVATILLITALPMIGFGVVELLVARWGWDRPVASLLFGTTLTVIAGGLMLLGWKCGTRASHAFANSRREALQNLSWLRDSIERQNSHH